MNAAKALATANAAAVKPVSSHVGLESIHAMAIPAASANATMALSRWLILADGRIR